MSSSPARSARTARTARSAMSRRPCPGSRGWGSTSSTSHRYIPSGRRSGRAPTTRPSRRRATRAAHPDLGSVADVRSLAAACAEHDMALALDLAFQCSPDHPWVSEHPEWFRHRADGTIRSAENPPKKYEDIYPFDFDTKDREGLWRALLDVVLFWIEKGVPIFRVDNPHT